MIFIIYSPDKSGEWQSHYADQEMLLCFLERECWPGFLKRIIFIHSLDIYHLFRPLGMCEKDSHWLISLRYKAKAHQKFLLEVEGFQE